jgi:hypothetical protein
VIVVSRFTTRWVLSAIFPIMATTWLGFLVFFLPKDDMNGRAGGRCGCGWCGTQVQKATAAVSVCFQMDRWLVSPAEPSMFHHI